MAPIIERLLLLLSIPQGNLIYAGTLVICTFAAWIACIYASEKVDSPIGRRMRVGLLSLFIAQMVLFLVSWLAWLGIIDPHTFLPVLDRMLALFSLVLIIWLWSIPESSRIGDTLAIFAEIFIILFGFTGMVLWLREGSQLTFNSSALGIYAYYSGLALILAGLILTALRHRSPWIYGFLMLLVMLGGYLAQVIIILPAADYAWFIHLGEMAAFLFLLLLPRRLTGLQEKLSAEVPEMPGERQPGPLDGKLIQSIVDVITQASPQKYYEQLVRLVAYHMRAEYCLLMIPPKAGEQLIIPVGYNASEDQMVEGFTVDGHKMPSVVRAVKDGQTLRVAGGPGSEADVLAGELGLHHTAHLLIKPFHPKGISALMGFALLSMPSMPAWNEADASNLESMVSLILSTSYDGTVAGRLVNQEEVMDKLQRAEARVDQVRLEYAQLKARYDSLAAQTSNVDAQKDTDATLEAEIQRVEKRNHELEALLAKGRPSMEEVEQLRQELRGALADLARVPSTLSKSDQKMLETQLSTMKRLDKMQPTELVISIAQEFRQPLSSMLGYTDLLLSESVGLLGAMQRKFLERIKASAERLGILMNELVEVVSLDGEKVDKTPVSVELEPLIHEAVGNISAQAKEKNITVHVDLPDELPPLEANKDAVLQILDNLLENACLVTPKDGVISLGAVVEKREGEPDFILISVTDQGGGIERTDISRVFLRRYKMENPLIKGVGDTGVGLSIVKSLVELLKGRVWVDSQPGGSTFSILLPLSESKATYNGSVISPG